MKFSPEGTENYRWNMNAAFMQQLDQRRNDKAQAAIEGDIWKWYRCNIEIFSNISPLIKEEKIKELSSKFQKLKNLFSSPENKQLYGSFSQTGKLKRLTEAEKLLQELDTDLMRLMFEHELIFIKGKKKSVGGYLSEDESIE